MALESATVLALVASFSIALQAMAVESGVKTVRRTTGGSSAIAAAVASVIVSVLVFAVILLVRGVDPGLLSPLALVPFVAAGMLDPFVLRLAYFEGIDRAGARISATVLAMNPAVATVIAVPILGEDLTPGLAVGIACIVIGGGILQSSGDSDDDGDDEDLLLRELAATDVTSVMYPVVAMVSLGISVILVKIGLERVPDPVLGATVGQTAALAAFLLVLVVSPPARNSIRRPNVRAYSMFALAGVFVAAALLSQYVALDVGSVVTVVPIINTFPLIVVILSYAAVRQVPRSPRAVTGVTAIVTGAILVQLF
jgi:drug/metabolite transporter (DMT)-like permease